MVHRPADSRLLTNLLSHEKDYAKHLLSLLDYSHSSLSSFTAYAAASSPPASQVILAVAGSFASADDALRRYAASIDQWREMMKGLKALEDEVGNIMRDREILVTRLIKASKSSKPPSNRDSLLSHQRYPSSSSLSVSVHDSPPPAPGTGPAPGTYAPGLNTSSKLAAAQAELQACEAHLATKERELAARRNSAIKDGLTLRCTAMAECGWVWSQSGKEALKTLEVLANGNSPLPNGDHRLSLPPHDIPLPQTFLPPKVDEKPLPPPGGGSDISSIGPSQSASQVNLTLPPPVPPPPVQGCNLNYNNGDGAAQGSPLSGVNGTRNSYQGTFHIPPAHSIDELTMPTSSVPTRHVLTRRITEEDIPHTEGSAKAHDGNRRSWVNQLDINGQSTTENGSESEDEAAELAKGELAVVENPRFASPTPPTTPGANVNATNATPTRAQSLPTPSAPITMSGPLQPSPVKEKVGSFFGGLKGFFGGKTAKDREREREVKNRKRVDSDDDLVRAVEEEESHTVHARLERTKAKIQADAEPGKGLFGLGGKGSKSGGAGGWETRTDKNLRKLARGSDEELVPPPRGSAPSTVREPAFEPVLMADSPSGGTVKRGRGRVISDAFAGSSARGAKSEVGAATGGKKLRKQRGGGGRSSSVPPATASTSAPATLSVATTTVTAPRIVRPGESDGEDKTERTPTSPTAANPASTRRAEQWVEKQTVQNTKTNAAHPSNVQPQPSTPGSSRPAGDKGHVSDTPGSSSSATPSGVTRRKSLGKPGTGSMSASGLAPAVLTATGAIVVPEGAKPSGVVQPGTTLSSGTGLSRNSSILTATPAPAAMKHQRSASTTGTAADFGKVQTPTGLGMGMPTTSVGRRGSGSGPHSRPGHRRSMSVDLSPVTASAPGATSVSVTRTASTSAAGRGSAGPSRGSATPRTPRVPAEMELVKAPPRVGRQDIINYDKSAVTRNIMMMEVPKAPPSVVDLLRSGGIEGGSDVDMSHHERRKSISGSVKEGSASAPNLVNGRGAGQPQSTSTSRPVKSPLRSALRNTSRSPSPQVNGTSSPIIVPTTPAPPGPPAIQSGPSSERQAVPPPPVPTVFPWEGGAFKGKGKVVEEDTTSISSYETGHEVFYSDADDADHEDEPESRHWTVPTTSTPKLLQHPQTGPIAGASDISTSTTSASTISPQPRTTAGLFGMTQDPRVSSDGSAQGSRSSGGTVTSSLPQRRKSVRVSLQPTFSPTPPAIDEDDDEEQSRHAPWVWKGEGSSKQVHRRANDVWEDSSEEDVEYQKAKRLLTRAAKKEKAR